MCPVCRDSDSRCQKKGFFSKHSTRTERVQRYRCLRCRRSFSDQTGSLTHREKKPHLDQKIFRLLNSGVSQRRVAKIFNCNRKTVARKLVRLARSARHHLPALLDEHWKVRGSVVQIDEMETIEHTKMKPLAIAVAVVEGKRLILGAEVRRMPAKGRLAEKSRRKYGYRADKRADGLRCVTAGVKRAMPQLTLVKSDECPRYPRLFKEAFPSALHETYKGRRAAVVGQGEMKKGGFDPIFSLNHTAANLRDNLKTLSRRTWCTPKRPDRLQALVDIYVYFHNLRLLAPKAPWRVPAGPILGAS